MIDKDCFSLVLDALENAAAALEESRDYPITLDLVLEALDCMYQYKECYELQRTN